MVFQAITGLLIFCTIVPTLSLQTIKQPKSNINKFHPILRSPSSIEHHQNYQLNFKTKKLSEFHPSFFRIKTQIHQFHDVNSFETDFVAPKQGSFTLEKDIPRKSIFGKLKKRIKCRLSSNRTELNDPERITLRYNYEYNESTAGSPSVEKGQIVGTKFVLLLHPIGVGISKWYYDNLLHEFAQSSSNYMNQKYVFLVPDLLGCGSGCNPAKIMGKDEVQIKKLPLLYPVDWAQQIIHFMNHYEQSYERQRPESNTSWCVVANGGCVSIALHIAKEYVDKESSMKVPFKFPLTNIVLSAVPSLESMQSEANPIKAQKAYSRLSGFLGDLFWWYSLRKDGKFIQKFSEKNLAASPENLGETWRPNCVKIASMHDGKSRFSTFSFLAGSLRGGCKELLDSLKGTGIRVDIIRGVDKRKNSAKSWFWEKQKSKNALSTGSLNVPLTGKESEKETYEKTLPVLLNSNGNGGNVVNVGGRICLAQEDPVGFSNALLDILQHQ